MAEPLMYIKLRLGRKSFQTRNYGSESIHRHHICNVNSEIMIIKTNFVCTQFCRSIIFSIKILTFNLPTLLSIVILDIRCLFYHNQTTFGWVSALDCPNSVIFFCHFDYASHTFLHVHFWRLISGMKNEVKPKNHQRKNNI